MKDLTKVLSLQARKKVDLIIIVGARRRMKQSIVLESDGKKSVRATTAMTNDARNATTLLENQDHTVHTCSIDADVSSWSSTF